MKLLMTPTSPFARKARALILAKGLDCEMQPAPPFDNDPILLAANPLRKVPVLITDDGQAMFDSHVICEYLDAISSEPRFLPQDAAARAAAQTREALADGAADAIVAVIMSGRVAPDMKVAEEWREWLFSKARRAADMLEVAPPEGVSTIGDIACFCMLDFWLFRSPVTGIEDWRDSRPRLAKWFAETAQLPQFVQTDPRDA